MDTKKQWIVANLNSGAKKFSTYDEAEVVARKQTKGRGYTEGGDMGVFELVAVAIEPTPTVEVKKVT